MQTRIGSEQTTLAAFALMVAGIGGNLIAIKYIARAGDLDAFWAAASRFVIATILFWVIAFAARASMPRGRALTSTILYGALSVGAFFAFGYAGLQDAPAGLASVILATAPLLTFLLALAQRQERFRWDSMAGAAIVVTGTAVVFRAGMGDGVPVGSLLALLAASACQAQGAIVVRGSPNVNPLMRNAIAMAVGSAMLLALMPVFGQSAALPSTTESWTAQAYLIVPGTVGVFALYLLLLSRWTASAVSYQFVLAPLVAILLGVWLFEEEITGAFAVGSALILVGVYLGALRPARAGS